MKEIKIRDTAGEVRDVVPISAIGVTPALNLVLERLMRTFKHDKKGGNPRWKPSPILAQTVYNTVNMAFVEAQAAICNRSFARMTIIHDTVDHYNKMYRRYETELVNGEVYLIDFYCSAGTVYKRPHWFSKEEEPTDERVMQFKLRIWINAWNCVVVPLVILDQFKFKDTYTWGKIERGLGLPSDVALQDRVYYFTKIDNEFREQYFKYRGGQAARRS